MSLASQLLNYLWPKSGATSQSVGFHNGDGAGSVFVPLPKPKRWNDMEQEAEAREVTEPEVRHPFTHCMLAGGVGGTTGDLLMHSLDTVKTRQQGDPHFPPKYTSMSSSYATIFRQEGIRRGLYGGVFPAFLGSFSGTVIFFGTYEYTKRNMIDRGLNAQLAYFSGGMMADLAASVVYVPSEVLKTRLQLQGRYNNPFFHSGYNYRSTFDAARTIVRQEGFSALFYGYKATLFRDLPFSALQFAFYEQGQTWAKDWAGSRHIGLPLEILTAAAAGGLSGLITCPLDVVKTRIQTQVNPTEGPPTGSGKGPRAVVSTSHHVAKPAADLLGSSRASRHTRHIATSSPSTSVSQPGARTLQTSSIFTGLALIYKHEGFSGWFRGVGPRFVWTSVQSTTMLVLYQILLRRLETHPLVTQDG